MSQRLLLLCYEYINPFIIDLLFANHVVVVVVAEACASLRISKGNTRRFIRDRLLMKLLHKKKWEWFITLMLVRCALFVISFWWWVEASLTPNKMWLNTWHRRGQVDFKWNTFIVIFEKPGKSFLLTIYIYIYIPFKTNIPTNVSKPIYKTHSTISGLLRLRLSNTTYKKRWKICIFLELQLSSHIYRP